MIEIAGQLGTKFNTRAAIWQGCQGAAEHMEVREPPAASSRPRACLCDAPVCVRPHRQAPRAGKKRRQSPGLSLRQEPVASSGLLILMRAVASFISAAPGRSWHRSPAPHSGRPGLAPARLGFLAFPELRQAPNGRSGFRFCQPQLV